MILQLLGKKSGMTLVRPGLVNQSPYKSAYAMEIVGQKEIMSFLKFTEKNSLPSRQFTGMK